MNFRMGGGGFSSSKKKGKDRMPQQDAYESSLIDPSSRGYVYDEVDDFEDERDKNVLNLTKRLMARKEGSKVRRNIGLYSQDRGISYAKISYLSIHSQNQPLCIVQDR